MTTDFVFAYGSNMNRSHLRSWLEANGYDSSLIVDATPATLEGHDFVWNYYSRGWAGGTANLEHKENSVIHGVLIEFEEKLLKAFDHKEGHPYFYSRSEQKIPVRRDRDGKAVFAWLYLAAPNKGERRDVWPSREYKRTILEAAAFSEFPADYVEKIKAWPTQ
jgi:gamma-glutamylcyclotransferase (GGCT)/AIG2-like uncharacterized protein YtfP